MYSVLQEDRDFYVGSRGVSSEVHCIVHLLFMHSNYMKRKRLCKLITIEVRRLLINNASHYPVLNEVCVVSKIVKYMMTDECK